MSHLSGMNVLSMSLTELSHAFKNKTLSVSEVLEKVSRQQDVIRSLNAFINVTPKERLHKLGQQSQKRQDKGLQITPLDGVPIIVKDNYCTSWAPTTCASNMLSNYTPPYDATIVTKLQEAGALIVGKSNMDEFAMGSAGMNSVYGPSKNIFRSGLPYSIEGIEDNNVCSLTDDGWLVTGGSSGGSAVAVAAGLAYGGLGSDTGGSVRNPASMCGIVGFKPSYGALSRYGLISLVNSLDAPGLLTRTCEDCDVMMKVLAGYDNKDSTSHSIEKFDEDISSLSGLVVGIPKEFHCEGLHPSILEKWQSVADLFDSNGAKVIEVSMPHISSAPSCYSVINNTEVASNFTRFTGTLYGKQVQCSHSMEAQYALTRASGLSQVVRDRVIAGNYFLLKDNKERYLLKAMKVRRLISDDFKKVFSRGVDILLTPTTLFPAARPNLFRVKNFSELTYLQDLCTSPANLAGIPALCFPVGYTSQNSANNNSNSSSNNSPVEGDKVGIGSEYSEEYFSHETIAGLPLSLQIMSPYGTDKKLISIGKLIEKKLNVPRIIFKDPL